MDLLFSKLRSSMELPTAILLLVAVNCCFLSLFHDSCCNPFYRLRRTHVLRVPRPKTSYCSKCHWRRVLVYGTDGIPLHGRARGRRSCCNWIILLQFLGNLLLCNPLL